ncbi:hypothetical protein DPMN_089499 [Dreissena polymorpha]|uniref:Uncharacterized protein n=1 Tax=Dreissena polymorpha TaxID=45954 RepID=A0A9D4KXZ6_DREPO|nr:hypothetical protein DPMN_089499 [Dreissena polymorpha]
MEQKFKCYYNTSIACHSYNTVPPWTLRYSLNSLLNLHITYNNSKPAWAVPNNPLTNGNALIKLMMSKIHFFNLFKVP